jgi:hypothetical protein
MQNRIHPRLLASLLFLASLISLQAQVDAPPTILSIEPSPFSTVQSLTFVNVIFSESVNGVTADDLLINSVAATKLIQNNPRDYTFQFPQPPTGAVTMAWIPNPGINDIDGLPDAFVPGPSWTYTLDPNTIPVAVIISEFMADNENGKEDDDGAHSDWLELYNPGLGDASLNGWYLTDNVTNVTKWRFPNVIVGPNKYLLIWASNKDRTNPAAPLHTNFKLSKSAGSYLALVDPLRTVVSSFGTNLVQAGLLAPYPAQQTDISFGRDRVDPNLVGYFVTPTPGAQNATSGTGFAPEPTLSLESGVYTNASLSLVITAAPGTTVRYTTNGTAPTNTSPAYTAPIVIANNSTIKVRAFPSAAGLFPSPVLVRNFLFLDSTTRDFNSNLPIIVLSSEGRGIDASVPPGGQRTRGTFVLFDTFRGRSALSRKPDYIGPVGLEVFGQTSAGFLKKPYRIELWDALENDKNVSILGLPADADWQLRNPYSDKCLMNDFLAYELFEQMGHYSCRRRFVEVFVDSGVSPTNRLSYPADYIGVEVLLEKIERGKDRVDIAELTVAHTNEPAITGGYIFKKDKDSPGDLNFTAGGQDLKLHEPKPQSLRNAPSSAITSYPGTNYTSSGSNQLDYLINYLNVFNAAMNATNWLTATGTNHYSYYIDVDAFVDLHWIVEFPKQIDGYRLSNFFNKDRNGKVKPEPIWDWNLSFGNADYLDGGHTNTWYYTLASGDQHIWLRRLLGGSALPNSGGDPDFIQKVIDRWGVLRTNIMNGERVVARIDEIANLLSDNEAVESPAVRNYAKYPTLLNSYQWPNPTGPPTWDVDYTQPTYALIISEMKKWTAGRYAWIDAQFPKAPTLGIPEGDITAGSLLVISAPAGMIYYTLDGTDPRALQANGAVAPGALTYSGTVTLNNNARVFARARVGTNWSPPTVAMYVVQRPRLVITEIMYHPPPAPPGSPYGDEDFEYLEFKNVGAASLNLLGYTLSRGLDFTFPNLVLPAGQRVLVVKNQTAFLSRYPGLASSIAGEYTGNLANDGNRIVLRGHLREPILDFSYDDDWYPITDGFGFSLVVVDENAPWSAWGTKDQWRPSGVLNGTPGQGDGAAPSFPRVVINEVLAHSDPPPPTDTIELRNLGDASVDVSGWYLTDDFRTPRKFRIPNGTTIAGNGYLTFDESQFNTNTLALIPFSLSSHGDEVYLFSADGAGNLSGYVHGFEFGASRSGVTFGRHVNSVGEEHFVSLTSATLGSANSSVLIGPVVITEIMYHPPDVLANGAYWNNSEDEFVELHNISGTTVNLYDISHPTNRWKLDKAIEFTFPMNTSIPAGGYVLVVNFDPVADPAQLSAFRSKYGVNAAMPIFGSYSGSLDNSGEDLGLYMPDTPETISDDAGKVFYVLVDRVRYSDTTPWPEAADGIGPSLQKVTESAYGDDPLNWVAVQPSPGNAYVPSGTPPSITVQPGSTAVLPDTPAMFSVTATGTPPLFYQWRFNHTTTIQGAVFSMLTLPAVRNNQAGPYSVIVYNSYGSIESSNGVLTVLIPAKITGHPTNVLVRIKPDPLAVQNTNASFYATASSSTPLRYQWQKLQGLAFVNISDATNSTLVITNVQLSDAGDYRCAIRDDVGTVFTQPGKLIPLITPVMIQAPLSQTAPTGGLLSASVVLGDGNPAPFYYEWRRGSFLIGSFTSNAKTNTFSFLAQAAIASQQHRLIVTNLATTNNQAVSAVFNITTLADNDHDGLPDAYEVSIGLDTNNTADASADLDGDTMSNLAEYLAGTDPADPNSYLRVDQTSIPGATLLTIAAVSNRTYSVQYKSDLNVTGTNAWIRYANIPARGTNHVETLIVPNVPTNRFWRVGVPAPP